MKMYCECSVSGEEGVRVILSFLAECGFRAGAQCDFKKISDDGEPGAILDSEEDVISEIMENNHNTILCINILSDSLFFSTEKKVGLIRITFHFDGWTIKDVSDMSSLLFSRLVIQTYRQVDGEFFNAYFE
ncbi:hypothetical protein AA105894_1589 [Asaia spathodeae NBRC 105894]|nr:hypothetical protein AA105894_1589 [Asaia spathodeae NBRC 105894]